MKVRSRTMKIKQALAAFLITALMASTSANSDPVKRFKPGDKTIAVLATENGNFTTLVAALVCTELVGAVSDPDAELTVFAPTDEAFGMLDLDKDNVCDIDNVALKQILLYHVVGERRPSPSVIRGNNRMIEMLSGGYIYPEGYRSLKIMDATGAEVSIQAADILASNGIIHVIDGVLMP
jgi:transforming growth factor-beta-induced protein